MQLQEFSARLELDVPVESVRTSEKKKGEEKKLYSILIRIRDSRYVIILRARSPFIGCLIFHFGITHRIETRRTENKLKAQKGAGRRSEEPNSRIATSSHSRVENLRCSRTIQNWPCSFPSIEYQKSLSRDCSSLFNLAFSILWVFRYSSVCVDLLSELAQIIFAFVSRACWYAYIPRILRAKYIIFHHAREHTDTLSLPFPSATLSQPRAARGT